MATFYTLATTAVAMVILALNADAVTDRELEVCSLNFPLKYQFCNCFFCLLMLLPIASEGWEKVMFSHVSFCLFLHRLCGAGLMPLAFTQEDFLLKLGIIKFCGGKNLG